MSVRWLQGLLFLILVIMSLPAVGQTSWQPPDAKLAIEIDGVKGELLANSRIFLSITALEGETVPSIFRVRYLARQGEQ